ncbi:hypothetical protein M413DRAFT_448955 [Hebeloma cylindrosporum]|uniref:Uncharacterized protein n=1 Tax=Hebeloma cylindrosporum TaxID=76867 RepID=A0A0C3BJD5_HEBCY|nr:hypothetical protein M413DRAFT_448955 [Hebeloma cylindrosporum h7]
MQERCVSRISEPFSRFRHQAISYGPNELAFCPRSTHTFAAHHRYSSSLHEKRSTDNGYIGKTTGG